jgi:uncharacterized repeat protein (TIGR01451 family)
VTLTMTADKTVTATFTQEAPVTHTLTVGTDGDGDGAVVVDPPGASHAHGTVVTLTAVANPGSALIEWNGDAYGTSNPITLAMTTDRAVTATFETGCAPVSSPAIARQPGGDALAGGLLQFTAFASGTLPFNYAWTIDGVPAGSNAGSLEHAFGAAGAHAVAVTVANPCGRDAAQLPVLIKALDPRQGELSRSSKMSARAGVFLGDILTYTLILRNGSPITAAAHLTDAIPAHTAYVAGSLSANLGQAAYDNGRVAWAGDVVSGTPVVIAFAVSVAETLPPGTDIENIALVDDGAGSLIELAAVSTFEPAGSLTINQGAAFTRIPTVTLSYVPALGAVDVRFSNDAGFLLHSGWLSVTAPHERPGWVLAGAGDATSPRAVYAQFRDVSGAKSKPVSAMIVYDPEPPALVSIRIISVSVSNLLMAVETSQAFNALVRISSLDANSGVETVVLANAPDMSDAITYTLRGGASLDVIWPILGSPFQVPHLYARVNDRAGNLSITGDQPLVHRTWVFFVRKNSS